MPLGNQIKEIIERIDHQRTDRKIYPYKMLIQNNENNYPTDIDISKRETYLSEVEFKEIFEITLIEFNELKKWKQIKLKRKHKLF
jgi:gelsolin